MKRKITDSIYKAHPTAVIDPRATVAGSSFVDAGAVIHAGVWIGADCYIGPNSVIGSMGFGFDWDEVKGWVPKSHDFGVKIKSDVYIGANTCVDRGSWRDTVISSGAIIDNQVHIAHNVFVGPECCIVAQAEVSGSVELGRRVYVAPGARIRERLKVGEGSIVGLGAVVTKDVPPGMVVVGVPARVLRTVDQWPPPPPEGR
jgi:UDP-3-O-[3-hydroxymyristoyl] glucosamine N-acyltransferase